MKANGNDESGTAVRTEWFRFGVYLAFLYATFTLAVFYLLRVVDQSIALVVTVVASVAFGVTITLYVLYLR